MDFSITSALSYPSIITPENHDAAAPAEDHSKENTAPVLSQGTGNSSKIQKQYLMELEEIQNFLYMIIGSGAKINTHEHGIGNSVNLTA